MKNELRTLNLLCFKTSSGDFSISIFQYKDDVKNARNNNVKQHKASKKQESALSKCYEANHEEKKHGGKKWEEPSKWQEIYTFHEQEKSSQAENLFIELQKALEVTNLKRQDITHT